VNTVGAVVQPVVVLGVAGEHSVSDPAERVSLLARALWRTARLLARIDDALDARPKGKLRHRALSR
jgi:hypothetical protein